MSSFEAPSGRVIDREQELRTFKEVLAKGSGPSVIIVEDEQGRGKTWLLELFEEYAIGQSSIVARVSLDPDLPVLSLCERIAIGLGRVGAPALNFERSNQDRLTCNHEAFGLPRPSPPATVTVQISETTLQNSHVTGAHIALSDEPPWPAGHESVARRVVCDALLADLRDISRAHTVVLFLDQYERRTDDIEHWLERALLTRVFSDDDPYGKFVLTVASTIPALPSLAKILQARSEGLLYSMSPLSSWTDEHITKWIEQHQLVLPGAVTFIRGCMDRGLSLHDLDMLKKVVLRG